MPLPGTGGAHLVEMCRKLAAVRGGAAKKGTEV